MKKICLVIFLLGFLKAEGQAPKWEWSKSFGGDVFDKVIADDSGNVYIVGGFDDSAKFGDSSSTIKLTPRGYYDIFLAKYDSMGNFKWVTTAGGIDNEEPSGIGIDSAGAIYIAGHFNIALGLKGEKVYFGNGKYMDSLVANKGPNIFVAKYARDGRLIWAKSAGGAGGAYCADIRIDKEGNGYLTGGFIDTCTFGGIILSPDSSYQIFTAKINSKGTWEWAKGSKGRSFYTGKSPSGIAIDTMGNTFISGWYGDTIIFDKDTLISSGGHNDYIVKMDKTGSVLWAHSEGGNGNRYIDNILIFSDPSGNLLVTGDFINGYPLDSIDWGKKKFPLPYGRGIVTIKMDNNGKLLWLKTRITDCSDCVARNVYLDHSGNSYALGNFNDSISFDKTKYLSAGRTDLFLVKYDSLGSISWVKTAGGPDDDFAFGFDKFQNKVIYVSGIFGRNGPTSSTASFDSIKLTTKGGNNFIAKLIECNPSGSSLFIASCNNYLFAGDTLTQSGTYYDTLTNINGCDSVITLNLTIYSINDSIALTGKTLTAQDSNATYQWYNCKTNSILSGDTNQSFTAKTSGDYAVILSKNGCVDTSACVSVVVTGVGELKITNYELRIYPNPADNTLNIAFNRQLKGKCTYEITDMLGRICHKGEGKFQPNISVPVSSLPDGVYSIQIHNNSFGRIGRFVVRH